MVFISTELKTIRDEVLKCTKCPLHKSRTWPVVGKGNHQADIVLVGEAPGFYEDQCGHPFRGKAGKVLDELLEQANLTREEIYICNVLKCRPPNNRNPLPEEIAECSPYLVRQLEIIQPKTIGCLGNFATHFVMDLFGLSDQCSGMTKIHGTVFSATKEGQSTKIIPLYHPASATYNPNMIDTLKEDFQKLKS